MSAGSSGRRLAAVILCGLGAAGLPAPAFGQEPKPPAVPGRTGPGGAATPSKPREDFLLQDRSSWWDWWALHEDRYLRLQDYLLAEVSTDEAWNLLGADPGQSFLHPSLRRVEMEVLPAVLEAWYTARDPELTAAALEALGGLGARAATAMHNVALESLAAPQRAVAEAAALGLARASTPDSLSDILMLLAQNQAHGRRLVAGSGVPERIRAFAVFGIGTAGARSDDVLLQHQALRSLLHHLAEPGSAQDEVRVAAAISLGVQPLVIPQRAEFVLDALIAQRELPGASDRLRAHLNVSIGRAGAACAETAPVLRERALTALLDPRGTAGAGARRGAVIALGLLARPEDPRTAELRTVLTAWSEEGADPNCRHLALISLAYLAAADPAAETSAREPIHRLLLGRLRDGRGEDTGWSALALGVLGAGYHARGLGVHPAVTQSLLETFVETAAPEGASACALALGLLSCQLAAEDVQRRMEKAGSPTLLRAGALALGMMEAREHAPYLRRLLASSTQDAETLRAAAIGLTLMLDVNTMPILLAQLRQQEGSSSSASVAAACMALAAVGDSRAVGPLLDLIRDPAANTKDRAAALRALGSICGGGKARWNAAFRHDAEYFSATDTLLDALEAPRRAAAD